MWSMYGDGIIDRTGSITDLVDDINNDGMLDNVKYSNITPTPLPSTKTTDKDFATICSERTAELKQIAADANKDILLLWSGGIDSTAALCAFIDEADFEFKVACNEETMIEYKTMYDSIVAGEKEGDGVTEVINSSAYPASYFNENYIVVTGELGDQLCGTNNHFEGGMQGSRIVLRSNLLDNWEDVVDASIITNDVRASLAQAPFEIVDFADFLWWFNFTMKWHAVENRLLQAVFGVIDQFTAELVDGVDNNVHHFYNSETFQQWAMSNRTLNKQYIVDNKIMNIKKPLKDYILAKTGDNIYYMNKGKAFSLKEGVFMTQGSLNQTTSSF